VFEKLAKMGISKAALARHLDVSERTVRGWKEPPKAVQLYVEQVYHGWLLWNEIKHG